jgi:carbon-monoxide dehydrogenase large subunit
LHEGKVELVMGTMAERQGHETSSAQLVTEWLGVRFDSIDYVVHDTARVAAGASSGGEGGTTPALAAVINAPLSRYLWLKILRNRDRCMLYHPKA